MHYALGCHYLPTVHIRITRSHMESTMLGESSFLVGIQTLLITESLVPSPYSRTAGFGSALN